MTYLTTAALLATVAIALIPILGALFAPLLLGLFLLALLGVFSGQTDRTVEQRPPALNGRGWRARR
jgi:uncharacterized membrane protein